MFRIRKVNKKNIAEEIKPGDIVQHFKRTDVWRFSDLRPPNGYVSQPSR